MIILIGGASHTGKTLLAQKSLEKYRYPYLSIDHLKNGADPQRSDGSMARYLMRYKQRKDRQRPG